MTVPVALAPHPRDAEPLPVRKNEDGTYWDDLAELMDGRYTIREWREAHVCERCGHCSWDPDTDTNDDVDTPCDHGCCVVIRCVGCGHFNSGYGIAGCPCDDGI